MLLFLGGILAVSGFSFAQDANLLNGRAGASSTIAYYGPYSVSGGKYWVALVEPENATYVLSSSELVGDPEIAAKVFAAHGTRVLASRSPGMWKYYATPARISLGAGSLLLGFAERALVPFAFGAEKVLVGSVAGAFLPDANAALGLIDASEEVVTAALGVHREAVEVYAAGWDARLALYAAGYAGSYEGAVAYSEKAGLVLNRTAAFEEGLSRSYGKASRLEGAAAELGAGYFFGAFGSAPAAAGAFREAGVLAEKGVLAHAVRFCGGPLPRSGPAEACRNGDRSA